MSTDRLARQIAGQIKLCPEFQAGHLDVADMMPFIQAGLDDACEQLAQEIETLTDRLRTYGCQQHQHGPAVYCPTCGIPLAHASNIVPLTHAQQTQEIERLRAKEELCGTWPKGSRRAFVKGAAWWAWRRDGATMFSSERDEAEAEAEKRFTETAAPTQEIVQLKEPHE